ncbi:MAG: ankyrin repeat domain-containing protein [Gemmatimonas sp.]
MSALTAPDELLAAIRSGDGAAVALLLDADPSLALRTGLGGESLVLHACYVGASDIAPRLTGDRALDACEAAALGDSSALDSALSRDAVAHEMFSGDGWTPLHLAGFFGQDACAERLLGAGASLTAMSKNSTKNTPLHAALAGRTNASLVKRLLDAGADARARGESGIEPLHLAASRGDAALCELLVARGASTSATMDDGTTPAELATKRGHAELGEQLKTK